MNIWRATMSLKFPPTSLNNLKFSLQGMKKVKSTSFAGYTAEEIEAAGKHDLQVQQQQKTFIKTNNCFKDLIILNYPLLLLVCVNTDYISDVLIKNLARQYYFLELFIRL